MDTSEIRELAELLRRLKETDKHFRVFGSDYHRYQLGSTLSETELAEFERAHKVRLPEDYRLFLHEVGNGGSGSHRSGAGPDYGIEPLRYATEDCDLSQSFPLLQEYCYSSEEEDQGYLYNEREELFGVLRLCEQGCGMYWYLVVNGPAYGSMWQSAGVQLFPTNLSFTVWYRRWVEEVLRILGNERLIEKLSIGMTRDQVVEATGGAWQERKNAYSENYYFESRDIPAQIILSGENGTVKDIKLWPFISP